MWKYLSLFLGLLSITNVSSLKCYTLSRQVPSASQANNTVLEDCGDMRDFLEGPNLDYSSPSCFTMYFKGPDSQEHSIAKGCMPGNGCEIIMKIYKSMIDTMKAYLPDEEMYANCHECKKNQCNSASNFLSFSLLGIFLTSIILLF